MSRAPDPPAAVRAEFPLSRLTTVGTGGPAEWFARAGSDAALLELLAWARAAQLPVALVGSGSNLLVADEGVPGLVLKLGGELARIDVSGARVLCGGGARLPAVAAAAARAGLSGIEFGVNIPGTVGGAVRMNANAYGGELARSLEWVEVTSVEGLERRAPETLGLAYRSSNLRDGEIVTRASFSLLPGDAQSVKATLAQLRERRREAQPQGIRTFGSTFKNPDPPSGAEPGATSDATGGEARDPIPTTAGQLLAQADCNGLAIGGARFSPKHANFVENTGGASTGDVIALMAEGRRRVQERFGIALEPEVQTLGAVRFPW